MRSIPTGTASGNQLSDPAGVLTSGYDVANRLTWGTKSSASVANGYGYDPDNRRVYLSKWVWNAGDGEWQLTGGGYEEVIYYGVSGQKMGTYRLTADASGLYLTAVAYNVWFGSKLVRKVAADGTATIVRSDRLGSFGRFYAYGEERGTPPPENTEKFATYYRDGDTGLDYAVNRYYSSGWGRFLTPDEGPPVVANPSSWNRYSYSWNDSVNLNDPDGMLPAGEVLENGCMRNPFGAAGGSIDASSNCPPGYIYVGGPTGIRTISPLERLAKIVEGMENFIEHVSPLDSGGYGLTLSIEDFSYLFGVDAQTIQIGVRIAIGTTSIAVAGKVGAVIIITVATVYGLEQLYNYFSKADIRAWNNAIREYEDKCGVKLTDDQRRGAHDEAAKIKGRGENLPKDEIIGILEALFGCPFGGQEY